MKRRFFIAGLMAAPVIAAAAPALAKIAEPVKVAKRSGFTAAELKSISDAAVTYYLADDGMRVYNGNDVVAYHGGFRPNSTRTA